MWARAVRLRWRHLLRFSNTAPVVLLFNDGTAGLLTGVNTEHKVVLIKDPRGPAADPPVAVDELRLAEVWAGDAVLMRASRGFTEVDAPFSLRWLIGLVLQEKKTLHEIGVASLTLSFLTIFPPLMVMTVVDKVLTHNSYSTLALLATILCIAVAYETLLGYARRLMILVIGTRIDARLNLHVFNRLLRLPLDYFERHPAGETMYNITQIHRVREFLTGKLMASFLDLMTLVVLLPFLFFLNASLAWVVLACACLITLIILIYLKPLGIIMARVVAAETNKQSALGETVFGVRTVKSLALEPQRKALWDERIAEAGRWRLAYGKLGNWPQTIVTPIERFMWMGVILLGAYWAMSDPSGFAVGSLFAFMMLSMRVAQPLVQLAKMTDEYQDVAQAIAQAASVLNRPLEVDAASGGMRPKFAGAITVDDLSFTYAGTKTPALDRVSFSIPAGTMLGVVGRSGSGKSTLTRLLQGINRDYSGFLKIDGSDLREINLRHLRTSFGVVLQDNFLFRGSIRDNILAGRPGLTLEDAVRSATVGRRRGIHRAHAERLRNLYRRRLAEPVGRPEAASRHRARADQRSAHSDPRRGDERARSGERSAGQCQSAAHRAGSDDGHRVAPPLLADRMRPDTRARKGYGGGYRTAPRPAGTLHRLSPALGAAEPPPRQPRSSSCSSCPDPRPRRLASSPTGTTLRCR